MLNFMFMITDVACAIACTYSFLEMRKHIKEVEKESIFPSDPLIYGHLTTVWLISIFDIADSVTSIVGLIPVWLDK